MLRVPDGGEVVLSRAPVVAVQISRRQRAPVVADDDAIWIEHRHDFEHEVFT